MISRAGQDAVPAVKVRGLSKVYGSRHALRRISFAVAVGECVAVIGPNGAGKTTLLRSMALLSRATEGQVWVGGCDGARQPVAARRQIGYLSHRTLLYDDLTVGQNLRFYARLYGLSDAARICDALQDRVGLASRAYEPVRILSRGMQQRASIARALLHRPALLLLDEPHAGLDAQARDLLDDLLRERLAEGAGVVMATHDLARVRALCDRVLVLAEGRLAADLPAGAIDDTGLAEPWALKGVREPAATTGERAR